MTLKYKTLRKKVIPAELILWIAALIFLALDSPQSQQHSHHFTLCPLANMGISWCPGCGLGRSITQLFQGNLEESFHHHWLGLPAVLIIGYRIVSLLRNQIKRRRNSSMVQG
ncbi:DUF2752 domain-containing protein [Pedobacter sp. AW31-3R]|uniref:DUF2752 domain-containing protein n=1 Tax=Pedobacter sp. AW31-3R TaxID=3445781 RepID=UPI003FA0FA82